MPKPKPTTTTTGAVHSHYELQLTAHAVNYHAHDKDQPSSYNDFTVLEPRGGDLLLESPPPQFKTAYHTSNNPHGDPLVNRPARVLGTFSVVAITFLYACGGPLGSEPIVSIAGPLLGLLGFIIYPLVYTIPYAGVVSELSAAFPEDGGFTIWILNAFGPFWAVQVGYWSWIAGVLSIAIYPSYILDIIARISGSEVQENYFLKSAIAIVMCVPALVGTRTIGRMTSVLLVTVLLPIVAFVLWSLVHVDAAAAKELGDIRRVNTTITSQNGRVETSGDVAIDWYEFINTLYWNYEGLRMASVFGGQVLNPSVVYSRAIWLVVALTASVYICPLAATVLSGSLSWTLFDRGAYEIAAQVLGGEALHALMVTCSFATCIGLHICGVFCCSTEISGMAENKLLPVMIASRNGICGSPHYAILVTLLVTLSLMAFHVDDLLPVANTFGSLVAASIFLSAIEIRRSMPYMSRPVRVPGGIVALVVITILPVTVCGYIIIKTLVSSTSSALLVLGFLAPAVLFGAVRSYVVKSILFR